MKANEKEVINLAVGPEVNPPEPNGNPESLELSEEDLDSVRGGSLNSDPEPFPYQQDQHKVPGVIKYGNINL